MSDPGLAPAEAVRGALGALRGGEPMVGVTTVAVQPPEGDRLGVLPGRRMLVWAERYDGTLGDQVLDRRTVALAREVLGGAPGGTREVEAGGIACTLYLEAHRPPPELLIVGAGHIARPLCRVGAMLGFRVAVLDDRPEFATSERFPDAERVLRVAFSDPFREVALGAGSHLVLVTRGHRWDYEALRDVLRRPLQPAYVGMVGSRRRVLAALAELAREGIARERLLSVHAPIGLDIGAETPEEIAVAIAAEIVRVRRGGTGVSLRDRERVVERWIGSGSESPEGE